MCNYIICDSFFLYNNVTSKQPTNSQASLFLEKNILVQRLLLSSATAYFLHRKAIAVAESQMPKVCHS